MFEFGDDPLEGDFALFPVDENGCPAEWRYVDLGDGVWLIRSFVPPLDGYEPFPDHNYQGEIDAL